MDLSTIISGVETVVGASSSPVTSMFAGAKLAVSVLPTLFAEAKTVAAHASDIKAKFVDLESKLADAWEKTKHLDVTSAEADLGAAYKDGLAIYDDVGLPRSLVQTVVATAAQDTKSAGFATAAEDVVKAIAKQLGLPALGSA